MEFLRQLYDWNERTFWNSLTKKLMSFLLLFFIDIGYLAIYFQQKKLIGEELGKSGASPESLQRIAANLALDTRRSVWAGEQPTVSLDPQVLNDLAHSAGPDAITVIRNATRLGLIDRSAAACLVAVYCLGLRSHEAAQRLSISADLVRWRNARSIRRLAPHAAVLAAA